jgi:hypothetical protein
MKTSILALFMGTAFLSFAQLNQINLPINWEGTTTDYTVTDFGGNASALDTDPTNAANAVLKTEKTAGAQTWAGTTLSTPNGLATPIPFAPGSTTISVRIYSPDANIPVLLKVEDKTDPTKFVETLSTVTQANAWQTVTFDFANPGPNLLPLNFATTYDLVSIFFNFGVDGATAGAKTYYCDDIEFGGASTLKNITFRVDMSEYSGTFTTMELNGTFNNWCGNCAPMTNTGNNIWEITVPLSEDSIEYKFSYDNWGGDETLDPALPCTKTTGQFTNRFLVLTGDTTLPAVCYASCLICAGVSVDGVLAPTFSISPNPSQGLFNIENQGALRGLVDVRVTEMSGRVVFADRWNASNNNNFKMDLSHSGTGIYFVTLKTENSVVFEKVVVTP